VVERIDLDTFDVAYHIIGGGEEGEKRHVETKEDADHNLRYLIAVALLDGMVTPAQYRPERIRRSDVQTLLSRVAVRPDAALSQRFPNEMPVRIRLTRRGGDVFEIEKHDYEGFHSRPMPWEQVVRKFERLAIPFAGVELCRAIADVVSRVEEVSVVDLMQLLAKVSSRRST
jgi:2-methylcitrate dehydratase